MKRLFAIYGVIVFALVIALSIPVYYYVFLTKKGIARDRAGHRISWVSAHILFYLYGIRLIVHGRELVKRDEVYIFVANHNSLLDVPAVAMATPNTYKFLAKHELTKIPLFGYIIKNLYFSVERKDKEDRARSMNEMKACLDRGVSLFLFPEGTRNKTREPLAVFYDGAFKLCLHTQCPIMVCTILNSKHLLNGTQMRPGRMTCIFSGPILPQPDDTIDTLKDKVRIEMLRKLQTT